MNNKSKKKIIVIGRQHEIVYNDQQSSENKKQKKVQHKINYNTYSLSDMFKSITTPYLMILKNLIPKPSLKLKKNKRI